MNLIGSYQHNCLARETFPFAPRCHQDNPYFQSWLLNTNDLTPEGQIQSSGYSTDFTPTSSQGGIHAASPRTGNCRTPAPRKERRRTESINTAFAELRECIPNVPADTKLSKIKTLRLATSYIAYLMDVLAKDSGGADGFKAEINKFDSRYLKRKRETSEALPEALGNEKKLKGRTGWPHQVWALELNP